MEQVVDKSWTSRGQIPRLTPSLPYGLARPQTDGASMCGQPSFWDHLDCLHHNGGTRRALYSFVLWQVRIWKGNVSDDFCWGKGASTRRGNISINYVHRSCKFTSQHAIFGSRQLFKARFENVKPSKNLIMLDVFPRLRCSRVKYLVCGTRWIIQCIQADSSTSVAGLDQTWANLGSFLLLVTE